MNVVKLTCYISAVVGAGYLGAAVKSSLTVTCEMLTGNGQFLGQQQPSLEQHKIPPQTQCKYHTFRTTFRVDIH